MRTTRRTLLGLGALATLLPHRLAAASPTRSTRFLFVFCPGGWDPALLFAPVFGAGVDHLASDEPDTAGGIPYVASPGRGAVTRFLKTWGSRTAFVNGIEVPSVAHDVCTRWAMTGSAQASREDWVSIIAGDADPSLLVPNVHLAGPLFPRENVRAHVRLGTGGQLAALLDGSALYTSDQRVGPLNPGIATLQDELLARRTARWASRRADAAASVLAEDEAYALARARELVPHANDLRGDAERLDDALNVACTCLEAGLSRTATVAFGVGGNGAWDAHADLRRLESLYQQLFTALHSTLARLDRAPGDSGGTLLDETVVVVLSEMGRTPKLNGALGKDHWTWTSALLAGGGIAGGRAIGGYDAGLNGRGVDLVTGEADDRAPTLLPGHVGATLLALAGIDPEAHIPRDEGEAISALMD